jgi:hypothetical protein
MAHTIDISKLRVGDRVRLRIWSGTEATVTQINPHRTYRYKLEAKDLEAEGLVVWVTATGCSEADSGFDIVQILGSAGSEPVDMGVVTNGAKVLLRNGRIGVVGQSMWRWDIIWYHIIFAQNSSVWVDEGGRSPIDEGYSVIKILGSEEP